MSKTAAVFPGQGCQFVGMGKDFADSKYFDIANEVLGFDLRKLCLEGPEEKLRETAITQPAILTISMILFNELKKYGFSPDIVAGHSLGEHSALCAANSIFFEEAVKIVRERGKFMQEAVPLGQGAMAAIIGLDVQKVIDACKLANCDIANFNSPDQVVISGINGEVTKATAICLEVGAKKIIPLKVSAPFHCRYMAPAASKLKKVLEDVEIKINEIPLIANTSADFVKSTEEIRHLIAEQLTRPVRWTESVLKMKDISTFVEVGPGKVLSGLIRKNLPKDSDYQIYNVGDKESLENFVNKFLS